MRVLTTRGGELAAPFRPICTHNDCACHHALTGLESQCAVELITVAERPDMSLARLTAACAVFLVSAGWDDDTKELAAEMAQLAADAAAAYPAGTTLRVYFDHGDECWAFTPQI